MKQFLLELISSNKKSSMMRFGVLTTIILVFLLGVSSGIVVLYQAFNCDKVDWFGVSAFIGALATLLVGVLVPKAIQKKHE